MTAPDVLDNLDVLILGGSGYGGGELMRLLAGHPAVRSIRSVSRSYAGQPFYAAHPQLRAVLDGHFDAAPDWDALAQSKAPVVFAAMPHGTLLDTIDGIEAGLTAHGLSERVLLVDLSGDFRLDDVEAFQRAYGRPHHRPELLDRFVYGLPEWQRERVRGARLVANPGCFATAIELALLPWAGRFDWAAVDANTGSSGSGASAKAGTHHPTRSGDFRAYKMLRHQHEEEILMALGAVAQKTTGGSAPELSFVPHSAPMVRGIFATAHLRLADEALADAERERAARFYEGHPFVRVVEGSPRVAAVVGSNFCELGVATRGRTLVVMTAIDNLVKGMAGQAIQNMNLALGLGETTGLTGAALYP